MDIPRVLGVHINHGFSSEARVFAELLRYRANRYDAQVLFHSWAGDTQSAYRFAEYADVSVEAVDVGIRPGTPARTLASKLWSILRFHASLPQLLRRAQHYAPDVVYSNQQAWD